MGGGFRWEMMALIHALLLVFFQKLPAMSNHRNGRLAETSVTTASFGKWFFGSFGRHRGSGTVDEENRFVTGSISFHIQNVVGG